MIQVGAAPLPTPVPPTAPSMLPPGSRAQHPHGPLDAGPARLHLVRVSTHATTRRACIALPTPAPAHHHQPAYMHTRHRRTGSRLQRAGWGRTSCWHARWCSTAAPSTGAAGASGPPPGRPPCRGPVPAGRRGFHHRLHTAPVARRLPAACRGVAMHIACALHPHPRTAAEPPQPTPKHIPRTHTSAPRDCAGMARAATAVM